MPGYRFLDHMTDLEVESSGRTLEEAFENAGRAVEDSMVDIDTIEPRKSLAISLKERDIESLLYSWIETLIALQDTDNMLFSKFSCKISKKSEDAYSLEATIAGEEFDPKRHEQKTAIKAPTFHDMKVSTSDSGVTLRFLLDL
jgi:SHS2 domain-containing protein